MALSGGSLVQNNAHLILVLLLVVVFGFWAWPTQKKCETSPAVAQKCDNLVVNSLNLRSNVGAPTKFLDRSGFSCAKVPDDGLGKNSLPEKLPKQLYPENKMNLQPFFEPSLVGEWQKSRLDPKSDPKPSCNEFGACVCPGDKLFDGRKCIDSWGADPYKALRDRWANAPLKVQASDETFSSPAEFAKFWESKAMFADAWTAVHAGAFRGKKVLDVGAGYARQSFVFALHGAFVTHLDVVPKV